MIAPPGIALQSIEQQYLRIIIKPSASLPPMRACLTTALNASVQGRFMVSVSNDRASLGRLRNEIELSNAPTSLKETGFE